MKLLNAIPVMLIVLGLSPCLAKAADPPVPAPPAGGVNVNAPGVGVHVNGDRPGVEVGRPNVGVDVQSQRELGPRTFAPPATIPQSANRTDPPLVSDNRSDPWRYKWESNRWWYYGPDNRWMLYSTPGGWTYYEPSGSYTAAYGGVPVAPTTTGTVPSTTYYYGYPYYYYGGPGAYVGGPRWGVRVGGWGGYYGYRRGRW